MYYIGHTKDGKKYIDDEHTQPLQTHLINVSKYAEQYSSSFGAAEVGALLGMIHDIGKYQADFQDRVRGKKIRVDHATQGAKTLIEKFGDIGRLYGMVVAAHHTGLKDSGTKSDFGNNTYSSRLNNYKGRSIDIENEIPISDQIKHKILNCDNQTQSFAIATYLKMLFSALVDADWTDTEEYINDVSRSSISYSVNELNKTLQKNIPKNNGSNLNNIREQILIMCKKAAQNKQGLFTLTVPTGGGKTLSSLSFALEHALEYNLKRVIYVIPYTSIIEQNADIISKCLGKKYVLEHHSNVDVKPKNEENDQLKEHTIEDTLEEENEQQRIRWATENWDIPIILTTNVQFFESFFSNKPSQTRKLHNIAESVVIFDEAQMLPRELLSPSMYAISELVKNYRVTAVLCSATQPAIGKYKYKEIEINEIIDKPAELFEKLKRVDYEFIGKKDDQEILDLLKKNKKVLCIVNSRKHAHALYCSALENCEGNIFHLSTLMTAIHRRQELKTIREKLQTGEDVIVISTSLIEAGVDIDFPVVIRSIAGIDSIIQAAGRANREGELEIGKVLIFEPSSENGKIPKAIQDLASITKEVIAVLKNKAFELEGIKMYFNILYNSSSSSDKLDTENILNEFEVSSSVQKLNFETVAKKYKIMKENTKSIVINNTDESKQLVKEIRGGVFKKESVRKLQQYSVSVYENEYRKLLNDNALEVLRSGYSILNNTNYYKEGEKSFGLDIFTSDNKNAEYYLI